LGSGSTIAACERLGRLGRGCEISPPYVAVCLERLSEMGLKCAESGYIDGGHNNVGSD